MAKIDKATSLWKTAAIDAIKQADPLKQKGIKPITDITSVFESVQTDLVAAIRGGRQSGIGIPLFGKVGLDGKLTMNKDALLSRAMSFGFNALEQAKESAIGSQLLSSLKTAEASVMDGLLGSFKTAKDDAVFVMIDGIKKPLESSSLLNKVNSLGATINSFTGTKMFKLRDESGQATFLKGLISQSLKNGLPNTFKALTKDIVDPRNIRKIAGNVLGDAIKSVDIRSVLDIGGILGKGAATDIKPMVTREMSESFAKISGETTNALKGKLEDVKDFFGDCVKATGLENAGTPEQATVRYAASWTTGNENFNQMLEIGARSNPSKDNSLLLLAASKGVNDVTDSLKSKFPGTVIGTGTIYG
jgi:hypothetical protein